MSSRWPIPSTVTVVMWRMCPTLARHRWCFFLFHICISIFVTTLAQGTGEVSSEQSFEYTNIRFLSLIELFLYSPLDIVTLISLFYPIYLISQIPQYPLAIFYPTYLILFIPSTPRYILSHLSHFIYPPVPSWAGWWIWSQVEVSQSQRGRRVSLLKFWRPPLLWVEC